MEYRDVNFFRGKAQQSKQSAGVVSYVKLLASSNAASGKTNVLISGSHRRWSNRECKVSCRLH